MNLRVHPIWLLGIIAFCLKNFSAAAQNNPAPDVTAKTALVSSATHDKTIKIKPGLKADEVLATRGQPYYQTEHSTSRPGEQVWLYTQTKTKKTVDEKQIIDDQTKWPTLYRKTIARTCKVGDIFVEVSQGVVRSVKPANANMAYGPCVIETTEEFLPIVDGKPVEIAARTVTKTVLEGTEKK